LPERNVVDIDLKEDSSGIYLVELIKEGDIIARKLVIKQ
jgi:hypothetical protein